MTIKEIAALAGVSVSTVSKIVNNKDININQDTRDRVLKVVKEYHYSPYSAVKNISEARTFRIGIFLKDTAHCEQLLSGILSEARRHGYSVMVYDSCGDAGLELKNITALCKTRVDGAIWEPVAPESLEYTQYLAQADIPYCLMNAPSNVFSYQIDYRNLGYEATQKLVDYRHSQLGCLIKESSRRSEQFFEGFRQCLFDNQILFNDNMKLSDDDTGWHTQLSAHLYTGIVSSHIQSSMRLLEQLDRCRYRMPYDLSLISLRDGAQETELFPRLSSIRVPHREFGVFLCQQLIAKCENKDSSELPFHTGCVLENTFSLDTPLSQQLQSIVVVGGINIDITLKVDELPQSGSTMITDKCSVIPGGKGANQAVGVARLGNEVSLIGKVGNDYEAALIYSSMEEHRVNPHGITRDSSAETGKAYIHVMPNGESAITILTGSNKMIEPCDILSQEALFENAGFCLLQTEIPEAAVMEAAKAAKRNHVKTILKPAALAKLPHGLMPYIDIFVPNKKEADMLCPDGTIEEKAAYFMKEGASIVIITLGHSGCFVLAKDISRFFPAASFTVADTTGAADAFISALAVYLLGGFSLEKAVRIATYAAGFCVTRHGVIPALVDRITLENYIKNTEPELLRL